jgi:hypothetical protein
MIGVIFSGADIPFDYDIFTPGCRRAGLADMARLH